MFFGTSGSDANDTNYKLVRYYNNLRGKPQKKKIISRQGAYHGLTFAAGTVKKRRPRKVDRTGPLRVSFRKRLRRPLLRLVPLHAGTQPGGREQSRRRRGHAR